jgi:CubicO group peptidase (beta-lactamase class C family)
MRIAIFSLALLLQLHLVSGFAASQTNFAQTADDYLSKLTVEGEFSGAVLIATNGNAIFASAYGLANRELDVANTTNTVFRLGSVTKQFTAMAILILQERNKLNVTNFISQYVQPCPKAWRGITIHHLLTHTSGIPNFTKFPDDEDWERRPTTVSATVNRFRNKPLEFPPGTKMHYSNSGYVLLGYIIEQVTKTSYEKFLTENIFQPLGMKHSGYDHPALILPNRASGYIEDGTNTINCIPYAMDTPHAAGALYSTVGDLLRWDQALYSTQLVSASSLNLMFTPYKGDEFGDFCYGWVRYDGGPGSKPWPLGDIKFNSGDRLQYWHPGGINGFQSAVIRFPKEKVYIAVLSNLEWANAPAIAEELSSLYFNSGK